jgi:hypothetical protein
MMTLTVNRHGRVLATVRIQRAAQRDVQRLGTRLLIRQHLEHLRMLKEPKAVWGVQRNLGAQHGLYLLLCSMLHRTGATSQSGGQQGDTCSQVMANTEQNII